MTTDKQPDTMEDEIARDIKKSVDKFLVTFDKGNHKAIVKEARELGEMFIGMADCTQMMIDAGIKKRDRKIEFIGEKYGLRWYK